MNRWNKLVKFGGLSVLVSLYGALLVVVSSGAMAEAEAQKEILTLTVGCSIFTFSVGALAFLMAGWYAVALLYTGLTGGTPVRTVSETGETFYEWLAGWWLSKAGGNMKNIVGWLAAGAVQFVVLGFCCHVMAVATEPWYRQLPIAHWMLTWAIPMAAQAGLWIGIQIFLILRGLLKA